MFKLSKEETARRSEIVSNLEEKKAAMAADFEKVQTAAEAFNTAVTAYNEVIAEAQAFVDEMVGQMDDYMNDKTEKWAEGDKGQAYDAWKSEWEGADLSELPEFQLDEPADADHNETLENLPDRPE